ncbi:MAG: hypothetical protein PHQ66_01375 [Candidatus Nanoarchaeia archaeon]|nr:hypothetical protein [Candidatus Nanoarchaeia archaeon]MDD5357973.1 hypothetical protein [Candidatus Nanoarchaeia archaeon]MDD5588892.1 hypothetical protein [Candidatus Nanoarchaeia archaeon]
MTLYSVIASDLTNTHITPKYAVAFDDGDIQSRPKFETGTLSEIAEKIYEDYKNSKDPGKIRIKSPNRDLVAEITKEESEITRQLTSEEMKYLTSQIRSYMINSK